MRRRTVIVGGLTVAAAVGAGLTGLWIRRGPDLSGLSEAAKELGLSIHEKLPPLRIEDAAYVAFLRDLERHGGAIDWAKPATHRLVQRFLLSTDFFTHGADERRIVAYVQYYDPYVSVCYDPFSRR